MCECVCALRARIIKSNLEKDMALCEGYHSLQPMPHVSTKAVEEILVTRATCFYTNNDITTSHNNKRLD